MHITFQYFADILKKKLEQHLNCTAMNINNYDPEDNLTDEVIISKYNNVIPKMIKESKLASQNDFFHINPGLWKVR